VTGTTRLTPTASATTTGAATTTAAPPTTPAAAPSTAAPARDVNPPGDIPDNQVFVPFNDASRTFTVSVPEGWARADNGAGASFTDKYNAVRIDRVAAPVAPTMESARATDVPAILQAASNAAIGSVTAVRRAAGPAVLITYQADSPVNAVTGKVARLDVERYEFWNAGTEAVLTLSGPVGADNVDPWRTVTDSLRWS
jgi:hypothetical protein